jgi:hypothetical protein
MIEVEDGLLPIPALENARKAPAIRTRKLNQIARLKGICGIRMCVHQGFGQTLNELWISRAKRIVWTQAIGPLLPLLQGKQAALEAFRELAQSHLKRGGLVSEGAEHHLTVIECKAVVKGDVGVHMDHGCGILLEG